MDFLLVTEFTRFSHSSQSGACDVDHVAKNLWKTDDHAYTWATKVQAHNSLEYLWMLVTLQFPFTGIKGPKPVPARQCPRAQSELLKDQVYQGWSGRTAVSCTEP